MNRNMAPVGHRFSPNHLRGESRFYDSGMPAQYTLTPALQQAYAGKAPQPSRYIPEQFISQDPGLINGPVVIHRHRANSNSSGSSSRSRATPDSLDSSDTEPLYYAPRPNWQTGDTPCADSAQAGPYEPQTPPKFVRGHTPSQPSIDQGFESQSPQTRSPVRQAFQSNDLAVGSQQRRHSVANSNGSSPPAKSKWQAAKSKQRTGTFVVKPIPGLERDGPDQVPEELPMTLTDSEYREVFGQVDHILRVSCFTWLAEWEFQIPLSIHPSAKSLRTPEDREYGEFVDIITELIHGRKVPKKCLHNNRICELETVLSGPSEARHILVHVSRISKPDRRVLGLIAAAYEVCRILEDYRGMRQLNQLYKETEEKTRARSHGRV